MEQTWRWFGPQDRVTLRDAREAGATGIVTALHQVQPGDAWPVELIQRTQEDIRSAGLRWSVVESLDVTDRLKLHLPGWRRDLENFIQSIRNLAACGIYTVAYNWMHLFSWMRTHLHEPAPRGGYTTSFNSTAFAAFDLYILKRSGAEADWGEDRARVAWNYLTRLSIHEAEQLQNSILQGLPGGNGSFTIEGVRNLLQEYADVDEDGLRRNFKDFLKEICPVADEVGVRICIHPDDPPRPLLGLPRIVSTAQDLAWLLAQYSGKANGLTFCTGALGVRPDNDLLSMVRTFGPRIGFVHLRSTQRIESAISGVPESFLEAEHLEGDAGLIGIVLELVMEQRRRLESGERAPLPFRPDHGQELLNDRERAAAPGYPAIGRLRGLAELRGAIRMAERILYES